MTDIAKRVIEKCGGAAIVANWLGITPTSVHRMTYPKERGGTGGLVPARHQPVLLAKAKEAGVPLTPNDFFDPPAHSPEVQ